MRWGEQSMMRPTEWLAHCLAHRCHACRKQRGQTLLIVLLLLGMAGAALVYGFSPTTASVREHDRHTSAVLAQAREALIGRAVADVNRPGSLPCPDADNDGSADGPFPTDCTAYVGRLPWRTLGLPDLRDGSGERLWYVLSSNFRDYLNAGALNPDTAGQLVVKNSAGTVVDNAAVAIVIAPGSVVGTQTRTPGTPDELNAGMYLDEENANGDAIYASALVSPTFNDRLVYVSHDALFAGVSTRVAKEVISALENYRAANHYYPAASPYTAGAPNYDCVPGQFQGYAPLNIQSTPPQDGCKKNWETGSSHGILNQPQLPPWFADNNWNLFTHYSVARICTIDESAARALCDSDAYDPTGTLYPGTSPLTVTGVTTNARMLVIVSGPTRNGLACTASTQCLEDAANSDGNNTYVKPSRFPASNDHMALTCSAAAPCGVVP